MRQIPEDILTKIQKLNQTAFENAAPMMQAIISESTGGGLKVDTIRSGTLGGIDITATYYDGDIYQLWIIGVVDAKVAINIYDYSEDTDFASPDRTYTLSPVEENAKARGVAICMVDDDPWLFWVERGVSHDTIYALQWDGYGSQPQATAIKAIAR